MSMETEKEKEDEKEVERKLQAPRLCHEVDGETRKELKLYNWELRGKVWRLRVAHVLHPREGEEIYFYKSDAQGKAIAVRGKPNAGMVSVPPTSTITCITLRCCLKVSVPRKVLVALGGANPFTETKKNVGWRVELGLFFQRRQSFLWAASAVVGGVEGKGDDHVLEVWATKVKRMDGWPRVLGDSDDRARAALERIVSEWYE
jgi:hypothetical protein